jgi:hypothetical protein
MAILVVRKGNGHPVPFSSRSSRYDPRLHAITIAQFPTRRRRIQKVEPDLYALFFDAERRNFRKGSRFNYTDTSAQRGVAAPVFDGNICTWSHTYSVAGKQLNLSFEVLWVADPLRSEPLRLRSPRNFTRSS